MRFTLPWAAALAVPLLWLALQNSDAQSIPGGLTPAARSSSDQFLIYGGNDALATSGRETNKIVLAPSLTAVSCERIKTALLTQLGATDRWRGRIWVVLIPAKRATGFDLAVNSVTDNWQYRIQAPDHAEPRQFIQAVIRTLLLEMANRSAHERSSEVPYWLAEGLTEEIIAANGVDLVVDAPSTSRDQILKQRYVGGADNRQPNSLPLTIQQLRLAGTRECFRTNPPLTIEQLSWPDNDAGRGVDTPAFRASSQLLVHKLLMLPDGPAALQKFVAGLPTQFNWQTTFLQVFSNQFDSLRALEKWWLLQTAHFVGRNESEHWAAAESWRRLDELLSAPVQIHADSNALPARSVVSLQTALNEWALAPQQALLAAKVRELGLVRLRLDQSVVRLADEYRLELQAHLNALDQPGAGLPRGATATFSWRSLARTTAKKLDELDARRREKQAGAIQSAAIQAAPESAGANASGRVP